MRPVLLVAIVGALVLGALNGCAMAATQPGASTAPTSATASPSASDAASPATSSAPGAAVDLLPTVWHVHGAAGAAPATYLLFTAHGAEVLEPKGFVGLGWATQGDEMITMVQSWAMSLGTEREPTVPWLTAARTFDRTADGWVLRDSAGRTLTALTDDGPAPPQQDSVTTPEPVDSFARAQTADAVAGPGVHAAPPGGLVGRWGVTGLDPRHASLTLSADGTWSVTGGCASGTGEDLGGAGAYRPLRSGFLLLTDGPTAGVGCAPVPAHLPADTPALTRFAQARSVLLQGDRLTLFDRAGKRIGTLTRLP